MSTVDKRFTLSTMITAAISQQSPVSQRGATRSPILARLAVNMTSGTMAKGNWNDSTNLAEDQKLAHTLTAVKQDHEDCRDDGKPSGDQPPTPKARCAG